MSQLTNAEVTANAGGQSISISYPNSAATGQLSDLGEKGSTGISARIPNVDLEHLNNSIMYHWTGQTKTINFKLQSDKNEGSTTKAYGRIYFKLSDDDIELSIGGSKIEKKEGTTRTVANSGGDGSSKIFTLHCVKNTDIYYLQVEEEVGETYSSSITLDYETYAGESATVQMWCDVVTDENADPIYRPAEGGKYLQGNWESAAWKWYLSYDSNQNNNDRKTVTLQKTDGTVQMTDSLKFGAESTSSATNNKYNSIDYETAGTSVHEYKESNDFDVQEITNKNGYLYGADPVQYIEYTQTLTLPLGMNVKSEITSDNLSVEDNAIYYTTGNGTKIQIASIKIKRFDENGADNTVKNAAADSSNANSWPSNLVSVDVLDELVLDNENNEISFKWRVNNKNALNYNSANNLNEFVSLVEWNQDIFQFSDDFNYEIDNNIKCTTEQIPVRTYANLKDDPLQYKQTAITTVTIKASAPSFEIDKKVNDKESYSIYLGDSAEFTLNVKNTSAAVDGKPDSVTDELPTLFKIDTDELFDMLVTDDKGSALTITITKAYLSNRTTPMEDIVLKKTDDNKISIQVGETTYSASSQTELENIFSKIGFTIKNDTQYKVKWDSSKLDQITAGGNTDYKIYANVKNTFELLQGDNENYIRTLPSSVKNEATVTYSDDKNYKDSATVTPLKEVSIEKSVDGLNDKQLEIGSELTYYLYLGRNGNLEYKDLPLTDTLQGTQVLLVPYEENKDNGTILTYDPDTYDSKDGTEYYKLNKAGTYENVIVGQIGNVYLTANKITVTKDTYSATTNIEWTLSDLNESKTVTYKALVDEKTAGNQINTGTLTAKNDAWLNNVTDDRLHATITTKGENARSQSKYILENEEKKEHSTIAIGDTVTYELKLTNGSKAYEQKFSDVYDLLPETYGLFQWSTDNVVIKSAVNTGNIPALSYTFEQDEDKNKTKICWNQGTGITLTPGQTLTFTVTLDFPSDETVWDNYCDALTSDASKTNKYIYNTLHTDLKDSKVSHDLSIPSKAVLQKGVYSIYRNKGSYGTPSLNTRTTYSIPCSSYEDYVLYYIALYNAGKTNLYLNTIEDVLPEGFEYVGLFDGNKSYGTPSNAPVSLYGSALASIVDENWSSVTYAAGTIESVDKKINDNVQRLAFKVKLDNHSDVYDAYYLAPNEALVIGYYAKAGNADLESAVNTAAMQFDDKTGSGLVKATGVTINASNNDGSSANEGKQEEITADEAKGLGFDFTGNTTVLKSDVAIREGEIVPGVGKTAVGYIRQTSDQKSYQSFDGTGKVIHPSYEVSTGNSKTTYTEIGEKWTVTLYNGGKTAIDSYTITDTMESPYIFYVNDNGKGDDKEKTYVSLDNKDLFYFNSISKNNEGKYEKYTIVTAGESEAKECLMGSVDDSGDNNKSPKCVNTFTANGVTFTLQVYQDESENFVMKITVSGQKSVAVPAGGEIALEFFTERDGADVKYKEFENEVLFQPAAKYKTKSVIYGEAIPSTENAEYASGIKDSDMFAVVDNYGTTSKITVTEDDDSENTASCEDPKNYIVLDREKGEKDFTYTLSVTNLSANQLDKMIFVSNLPESGDQAATANESRGSEFKVSLQNLDQNDFGIEVYLGGEKLTDHYTIQFSTSNELTTGDQTDGETVNTWMTYNQVKEAIESGKSLNDIRSYRVIIDGKDIIKGDKITEIKVPATISGETQPDQYARCNFAYYYEDTPSAGGSTTKLQQVTKLVGVKTSTAPVISKSLEIATGNNTTAKDLGLSAKFIALKNESGKVLPAYVIGNEQEFLQEIYNRNNDNNTTNNVEFTIMDLSPKDIDAEYTKYMTDLKQYQVTANEDGTYSCSKTETAWNWNDESSYTFYEFDLDDRAEFKTLNSSTVNGFTYKYMIDRYQSMEFVNKLDDYKLAISKTNTDKSLSLDGAGFARYKMIACGTADTATAKTAILNAWNASKATTNTVNSLATKSQYQTYLDNVKAKNLSYQLSLPSVNNGTNITDILADNENQARPVIDLTTYTDLNDYAEGYFRYAYIIKKNGTYYACILMDLAETGNSSTSTGDTDTAGIYTAKGSITYSGITDDSYLFMEVYAPSGYQLNYTLKEVDRESSTVSGATQTQIITDNEATELPMTGGSGRRNIYLIGFMLMIIATAGVMIFLIKNQHMEYVDHDHSIDSYIHNNETSNDVQKKGHEDG